MTAGDEGSKVSELPRTAYRSADGITIYSKPGGTLTVEEQEDRFRRIRFLSANGRNAVESLPRGREPDDELDAKAEAIMSSVFPSDTKAGIRLYLAWIYFRMVRRPGSPEAGRIDHARADLRLEVEGAIVAAARP